MQVYRGSIELLDYVFYATVERGKVYETGSFIHNYALAYALGTVQGETYTYAQSDQQPHYVEELTPLNGRLYLTPGSPQRVAHRLIQWNTIREGYVFPGKPPSLGYPDWGFARMLRPESRFVFYVLVPDMAALPEVPALLELIAGRPARIRLGKFPAKARLQLEKAERVLERDGPFRVETLLNWRDLGVDPVAYDLVATSLPTRLLARAQYAGTPYYEAHFGSDIVCLPLDMKFLARPPIEKRRR